jgi:hypothetical protein
MQLVAKVLELISALSGAGGTAFLYFGTFGFEAMAPYSNQKMRDDMFARNRRRQRRQRFGLVLLMVSFLCALAHVFVG